MPCPVCHEEAPSGATLCASCGAELEPCCPRCGAARGAADNFCRNCGLPLGPPAGPTPPAGGPRFASPEAYTPRHLVERILTSKDALEGERKQVTVLFADVKGSMELLVARDPEEARTLLDPVLEQMMEAVHRYEGTVNQVMGDGIMALFGAPVAHEDHAVRACYAALSMQEAVRRYAEAIRRTEGVLIQIRVGMNSGEVVVRTIGSDLRMDYSAVGQTTHLAGRMEQMAAAGSILITRSTLTLAEGHVQVNPLGLMPVKGLHAPVEVYELTGAGPARSRHHVQIARGRTRFVGRDDELDRLRGALERAAAGHGQVVSVVGEPGIGKSRLFWEFTHSPLTRGWLVLDGGAVSYGTSIPYLPVTELLKAYFGVEARDDARTIREKVTGRVLSLDRALDACLPALLALLEVPGEEPAWERLDPSQRRLHTLDAVKRLLLREAQVRPVLVVVEDLHWADSETGALLDGLVESLAAARLLLLVNHRPEYEPSWGDRAYCSTLRIQPLPSESAADLLGSLLGTDPSVDGLTRLLIERTAGNPLFLEECVRTLAESGALVGERGAYRLLLDADTIQLPPTVQAILAARIDRLSPGDKHLLQAAAVVGKDVPGALLQAIAGMAEPELRGSLARLRTAELLYEARLFPDVEYTFKHALTQEVAYRSLLHPRRRALHARIVEAMESLFADRLLEQTERLAHHAYRGEMWEQAVSYFRQAGGKALQRSAYREAVDCFEHALSALAHLPESPTTAEAAIDLRLDAALALFPLAEGDRARRYMLEAETLARGLDDQLRLFRVCAGQTLTALWDAEYERAIAVGQRAASIAERLGDLGPRVTANVQLGAAYFGSGQHQEASALHTATIDALQGELLSTRFGFGTGTSSAAPRHEARPGLAWVHSLAAMSQAECGRLPEAAALAAEALQIARQVDRPVDLVVAGLSMGWVSLHSGDVAATIPLLHRCRAMCRDLGLLRYAPFTSAVLGYALAHGDRCGDALPLLMEAVEQAASRGVLFYHARWVLWAGETQLRLGQIERALALAQESLALSRERRERGTEAWALRLLGEIRSHAPSPSLDEAARHYHEAMTLAGHLGMRPLMAHCHVGLAALSWRAGEGDEARRALGAAMSLFEETGMQGWRGKAEAAMRRLAASA